MWGADALAYQRRMTERAREARRDDVKTFVAAGKGTREAAEKLGVKRHSLYRHLLRTGRLDLWKALRANDPDGGV